MHIKRMISLGIFFFLLIPNISMAKIVFLNEFVFENTGSSWVIDALNDEPGDIALEFGAGTSRTIEFDTANSWFSVNDDLNVKNNLYVEGEIIDSNNNSGSLGDVLVSNGAGQQIWQSVTPSKNIQNIQSAPSNATLASVLASNGQISLDRFDGIIGTSIASLTGSPNFPNNPSASSSLNLFEAPLNILDNYGNRVYGYVIAPQTGNYTFWISGDDNSELYLSTNLDPANSVLIADVPGWTSSRQWNKYAQQQSAPIPLVAGQAYYIEALMKEGGGGDNLAVGWQLPDNSLERPILGNNLSPFSGGLDTQNVSSSADLVLLDTTLGGVILNLPDYSGIEKEITIKRTSPDNNVILITPAGGLLIDGQNNLSISDQGEFAITLQSDGSELHVLSKYNP